VIRLRPRRPVGTVPSAYWSIECRFDIETGDTPKSGGCRPHPHEVSGSPPELAAGVEPGIAKRPVRAVCGGPPSVSPEAASRAVPHVLAASWAGYPELRLRVEPDGNTGAMDSGFAPSARPGSIRIEFSHKLLKRELLSLNQRHYSRDPEVLGRRPSLEGRRPPESPSGDFGSHHRRTRASSSSGPLILRGSLRSHLRMTVRFK
jgi:hypothetical protein